VLVLDEAQYLADLDETPTEKHLVRDTLDMIHNGDVGRPVVLLAAGLGTTERAFNSLGISRFGKECIVQLSALDIESERAVILDWLIEEGKVKGHPKAWIDAIAEQAHGWPQHIISYIEPALETIKSKNRQMTDEGLEYVLEKGAKSRQEYYNSRAHDIDEDERQAIARSISDVPFGETMTRPAIMSGLRDSGLNHDKASELFDHLLEREIIDKRDDGRYGIPIPSMQKWLLDEYGQERIEIPREDVQVKEKRHSRNDGKGSSKWSQER